HVGGLHGNLFAVIRPWELCPAHQAQGADHQLCRTLDLGKARLLEEVRVEQHPQDRPYIVPRLLERCGQGINGLGVAWRGNLPAGDLRLLRYKEVGQRGAHELGTGRLLDYNVDDVLAVKSALVTQELLLTVVMILGDIFELPREASIG